MEPHDASQPSRKCRNSARSPLPAKQRKYKLSSRAIWDGLSNVFLEPAALQELDRRNDAVARARYLEALRKPARVNGRNGRAQLGGPDLSHLRGYSYKKMDENTNVVGSRRRRAQSSNARVGASGGVGASGAVGSGEAGTTAKPLSAAARAFQQHMIDHRIFPDGYVFPDGHPVPQPSNFIEITDIIEQANHPSTFTAADHKKLIQEIKSAKNEARIAKYILPIIEGDSDRRLCGEQVIFQNLRPLTDGALAIATPDLFYGAIPELLDRRIRDLLGEWIMPSTQEDLPLLPNFFLTAKASNAVSVVADRQALYNAALGERGIIKLRRFLYGEDEKQVYDNAAHTITCIYFRGVIEFYAIHVPRPSDDPAHEAAFVMTRVGRALLDGRLAHAQEAILGFRSLRDWSAKQRDGLIRLANERIAALEAAKPIPRQSTGNEDDEDDGDNGVA